MGKTGRDVAAPGVRELVVGDFRVFYEVDAVVSILTLRRSRQLIDESELSPNWGGKGACDPRDVPVP